MLSQNPQSVVFGRWRQTKHGQGSLQSIYKSLLYDAILNLRPNWLCSVKSFQIARDQSRTPSIVSTVTIDKDSRENRFWLSSLSDGSVRVYDTNSIELEALRLRECVENPPALPLGYVASLEEKGRRELRQHQTIEPQISAIFTLPSKSAKQPRPYEFTRLSDCKFLRNEYTGLLSCSLDGTVAVWDIENLFKSPFVRQRRLLPLFHVKAPCAVYSFAISKHSDNVIACCCADSNSPILLADLRMGSFVGTSSLPEQCRTSRPSGAVSCQWSPKNPNLLVSGSLDGIVRCWDIRKAGGGCITVFDRNKIDDSFTFAKPSKAIRGSRLEKLKIALASSETTYSQKGRQQENQRSKTSKFHGTISFAAEDNMHHPFLKQRPRKRSRAQTPPSFHDTAVSINKNIKSERISLRAFEGHSSPVTSIHFSQNGDYVISTALASQSLASRVVSRDHIRLWNVSTGHLCPIYYQVPTNLEHTKTKKEFEQLQEHPTASIRAMQTDLLNDTIFCCGLRQGIAAYDALTGELLNFQHGSHSSSIVSVMNTGSVSSCNFNCRSNLISGDMKGAVSLWRCDQRDFTGDPEFLKKIDVNYDPLVPMSIITIQS